MISKRALGALLLAVALLPASLAAQAPDERIQAALERAERAGIPTSLLESKIAEGRAKGIPPVRVANAVERRLEGLSRARDVLVGIADAEADALSVAADALETGVTEAMLAEVAEAAPRERRAVAIAALSQLVAADVAPQVALDRVRAALARGPEALQSLPSRARGPVTVEAPVGDGSRPDGVPAAGDARAEGRADRIDAPAASTGAPGEGEGRGSASDGGGSPDGGGAPSDGAGGPPDGGGAPSDGGSPPSDGGGGPPDGGGAPSDGGGPPSDGGGPPSDGGGAPSDGGGPPSDGGGAPSGGGGPPDGGGPPSDGGGPPSDGGGPPDGGGAPSGGGAPPPDGGGAPSGGGTPPDPGGPPPDGGGAPPDAPPGI